MIHVSNITKTSHTNGRPSHPSGAPFTDFNSAWLSDHMPIKWWDEITYQCPNFNGYKVAVWEWILNFIPHFGIDVHPYPCWDQLKLIYVSKTGPRLENTKSTGCTRHKGQWRGALMFIFICAWINGWVNNRKAGVLWLHCAHYDVIVVTYEQHELPLQSRALLS